MLFRVTNNILRTSANRNDGIMEGWKVRLSAEHNIPTFHHSTIPTARIIKPAYAQYIIAVICTIVMSCADPAREYSPALKHSTPGNEYMPDMYRSPSYETNSENNLFPDKKTSRDPVRGTVPRFNLPYEYSVYGSLPDSSKYILGLPFRYPGTQTGYDSAGKYLYNPLPATTTIIDEGKILFEKYCIYCHGSGGKGDGVLVQKGKYPPPPSYSTGMSSRGGTMKDLPAGKIYHTIMYGVNLMGPHEMQLSPDERWKVVHYVQKLQKDTVK